MENTSRTKGCIASVIVLIVLLASVLFNFPQAVCAQERGPHHEEFLDNRYGHNHYYPARGHYVNTLPGGHRVFVHGGLQYYYYGGVWYRPYGARFLVVAPPLGLIIPFLPPYYATIWVGGAPYYYANEVYYAQAPGGYMIVAPPEGAVSQVPPGAVGQVPPAAAAPQPAPQIFMYPRKGQSEKQQAEDRFQCHLWAVGETKYDPTQPPGGVPSPQKNADYQRAMGACLDARGYTVK